MIKIIITAFTNTKSTFLINILHGFFYVNEPIYADIEKWLIENGYPQTEIDACGEHFWCRYWMEEDESNSRI